MSINSKRIEAENFSCIEYWIESNEKGRYDFTADAYVDKANPYYVTSWRAPVDLKQFLQAVKDFYDKMLLQANPESEHDQGRVLQPGSATVRGDYTCPISVTSSIIDPQIGLPVDQQEFGDQAPEAETVRFGYPYNIQDLQDQGFHSENIIQMRLATAYGDFYFDDSTCLRNIDTARRLGNPHDVAIGYFTNLQITDQLLAFIRATNQDLPITEIRSVIEEISADL